MKAESQGTLTVDVVSRKAVRNFECFGEGGHIVWDERPCNWFHELRSQQKRADAD